MRATVMLVALLVSLATPGYAADDIAAAQNVVRSQAEALGRDDAATAYSFAAPAIQGMFPEPGAFMDMVRNHYSPVYRHRSFEFGEARNANGRIEQDVRIIDGNGVPWDALYTLEQQADGSLKIIGCLLKAVGTSA
ncbi:MAG: hypothetical protein JWR89_1138 [Tardiphaga sp.]|jgi:hypothetical protein|uniref:DUF4864 domain-containing protein n=1 Tax=Tardiphaga sp. TaxID=1926292 RepID=UPI00261875BB|nr:DUF4864 domain-containing protein [Tardiphaga sp.]MDB5501236.1 hypothetical protein [Tardiphaga sp.]